MHDDKIGALLAAIHDKHDSAVDALADQAHKQIGQAAGALSARMALDQYFNDRMMASNKATAALRAVRAIEKFLG